MKPSAIGARQQSRKISGRSKPGVFLTSSANRRSKGRDWRERSDYTMWIMLGGGALGAIFVSPPQIFIALHPTHPNEGVHIVSALAHLLVLITSGWYYTYHHSPENTFHDVHGKRISGKSISYKLLIAFGVATGIRGILVDGSAFLEKGTPFSWLYFHLFSSLIILMWGGYYGYKMLRSQSGESKSSKFIDLSSIEARDVVIKKLHSLSEEELEELAVLLYQNEKLRSFTFQSIVGVLWRSIAVAFAIQLLQALLSEL